jgi:hypothetical protein
VPTDGGGNKTKFTVHEISRSRLRQGRGEPRLPVPR